MLANQLTSFCLDLCCLSLMMSWCSLWHPTGGSLSWLPAHPGASCAETSLPEKTVGLLVFIMPTDVHCDFMYANFPLPPPSLRSVSASCSPGVCVLVSVSTRLQYKFLLLSSNQELQPLNTLLLAHIPEQEHCTSESAHWKLFLEGCLVTLSKATERLWILLLKREDNQLIHSGARTPSSGAFTVVKPLLD